MLRTIGTSVLNLNPPWFPFCRSPWMDPLPLVFLCNRPIQPGERNVDMDFVDAGAPPSGATQSVCINMHWGSIAVEEEKQKLEQLFLAPSPFNESFQRLFLFVFPS